MAKLFYVLASIATVLITTAHVFGGGPIAIDPLLAQQDIPEVAKWLLYFCWHDGTVVLLVCAGAFAYAGIRAGQRAVGVMAALIVSVIGGLGLGVTLLGSASLWSTPAPYAFSVIAALGWIAVARDKTV